MNKNSEYAENIIMKPKKKKKDEVFYVERNYKRKMGVLKWACIACAAIACVTLAQELGPLDIYANPGIDQNTNFVIAHAGGELEGNIYLNCVEGVDYYYARGTRMFEIDFIFSQEGELVGIHNFEHHKGYSFRNRISYEDYINTLIRGKYHGITSERLLQLMQKYPDAKFIIDSKEDDHFGIYRKLVEDLKDEIDLSDKIIPFVSSAEMLEQIEQLYSFDEIMLTNYKAFYNTDTILKLIDENPKIKYLHVFFPDFFRLDINEINKKQVRVFAHMDHESIFRSTLNYGCTGIFSDDISEQSFEVKYKYIIDQKIQKPKSQKTTELAMSEIYEVTLNSPFLKQTIDTKFENTIE